MSPTTNQRKVVFTTLVVLLVGLVLTLAPSLLTPARSAAVQLSENLDPEAEIFLPAPGDVLLTDQVAGQILTVRELDPIDDQTARITSCGQGVLYSTSTNGALWVNLKGGSGVWMPVAAGTTLTKIACDRRHLYALKDGILFHATVRSDGQLDTIDPGNKAVTQIWTNTINGKSLAVPAGTDEIEGGMGNIYALAYNSSTHIGTLYSSQLRNPTSAADYVQGSADSWLQLANNLGARRATGAGSRAMFTSYTNSLEYRKTNRAFAANADQTLYYNDGMLDGVNWWTQFPNPGLTILSIAADSSNTMYALTQDGQHKHLVRFSFAEGNCTDHLDNDANGQFDTEDVNCRARLATTWCQTHTGNNCIDRIHSDSNGYSHALVTCHSGGQQPTIQAGLCVKSSPGHDNLAAPRANPEPYQSGHYCNVMRSDGSWDFDYVGATPCRTLLRRHPRATIVRAGIYSTTNLNNVLVRCNDGGTVEPEGIGTLPLEHAYNSVAHTKNRCVFTVSPKAMRVFNAPFPTSAWNKDYGWRGYGVGHVFDHVPQCADHDPGCPCGGVDCPVELNEFGNESGQTDWLDNNGRRVTTSQINQNAYDYVINEGTPLRSLGYGVVVKSRDRDLSSFSGGGTTYQGEIYIRYDVGSDPVYAETFVAYYAHLGRRLVVDGQTVQPGQLIGYSGTTGFSSDPHLHFGLIRLSNTNGHNLVSGEAFGYHIPFAAVLTTNIGYNFEAWPGTVDPYGWRAGGIDPAAYRWALAVTPVSNQKGLGAWSPQIWISGEVPPYPAN